MSTRWIRGDKILRRWKALDFELLQAFNDGLCPYCPRTGKRLTKVMGRSTGEWKLSGRIGNENVPSSSNAQSKDNERRKKIEELLAKKAVDELKRCNFKMLEVLDYEQKHNIGLVSTDFTEKEQAQEQTAHVDTTPENKEIEYVPEKEAVTSSQAMAYICSVNYRMSWFEIGKRIYPEEAERIEKGIANIKRDSFIKKIKRKAEEYAEQNNLPDPNKARKNN